MPQEDMEMLIGPKSTKKAAKFIAKKTQSEITLHNL
jgi:hypothetical protein